MLPRDRSIRKGQKKSPGVTPSPGSPLHPQGAEEEGHEEQANAGEQQVQQALHDNAQDAQRHRHDHQQQKEDKQRSSAQLSRSAAGQPPLTASARLASDPVVVKSGGQTRLRTGARSEALSERNQLAPGRRLGRETGPLADELSELSGRRVDLVSLRALHPLLQRSGRGPAGLCSVTSCCALR